MNAIKLMNAIGSISDRYVEEAAMVKPIFFKKVLWLKIVSIAACFTVMIGTASVILKNFESPTIDTTPEIQACVVEDDYYELIDDKETLKARGLPQEITSDSIGDYYGICVFESDGRVGKAYDYLGYEGDSILILEIESKYYYLFFCNPIDNKTVMPMSELQDRYGLKDNITSISVNGQIIASGTECKSIAEELLKADALSSDEFNNSIFNGKTEKEQQNIINKMKSVKIVIHGDNADTLVLDYYPSLGYAYNSNTYYKFTTELINLLN